jgi:hypothetical protein
MDDFNSGFALHTDSFKAEISAELGDAGPISIDQHYPVVKIANFTWFPDLSQVAELRDKLSAVLDEAAKLATAKPVDPPSTAEAPAVELPDMEVTF